MPYEFTQERRVEFHETDMAGIVHFSNFFRYMESAEHAFFRSLGQILHGNQDGRMQGWARVHAECDYRAPLRYPDLFEVRLLVRKKSQTTLSYDFVFTKVDPEVPLEVARGMLTVVCVAREPGQERMRPVPMPARITEQVEVAPEELLRTDESRPNH
ncbi:MAG: thioesterase family protein [Planctomycetota bacterium]